MKKVNCDNCGACCKFIEINFIGVTELENDVKALLLLHNIEILNNKLRIFIKCNWLDEKTNRCMNYDKRSQICKDFEMGGKLCLIAQKVMRNR